MILHGLCKVQNKKYSINVDILGANALEDIRRNKYSIGRIDCKYASQTGKCNGHKCSILEENGIKR